MSMAATYRQFLASKLLVSAVAASGASLPNVLDATTYAAIGRMQRGTVLQQVINGISFNVYRMRFDEKIARLRTLLIDGTGADASTTVTLQLGLFPPFSGNRGLNVNDDPTQRGIEPTGYSFGSLAAAQLNAGATSLPGTWSVEPWTGAALPGSLTSKNLRQTEGKTWSNQQSTQLFQDEGFASNVLGSILLDCSWAEYLIVVLSAISNGTKIAGVLCGLETETA